MKALKVVGVVIVVIILGLVGMSWYYGAFSKVAVSELEYGQFKAAYLDQIGDYSQSGRTMDKVKRSLQNDLNVETVKGFGVYLDDPKSTPQDKLRAQVGCLLEDKDYPRIREIAARFKIFTFKRQQVVYAEFPFKGTASIYVAIAKVYPALFAHVQRQGYSPAPVLEIYDMPAGRIVYLVPIVKK